MSVTLSPAETEVLKKFKSAVEQQEQALLTLRQAFSDLLQERYQIDLTQDKWTLDLDTVVLVKEP